MNVVVDQLQQKPHDISQDEGGDQVPVDDVSQTPYTPVSRVQQETHFTLSFHGNNNNKKKNRNRKAKEHNQHMKPIKIASETDTETL